MQGAVWIILFDVLIAFSPTVVRVLFAQYLVGMMLWVLFIYVVLGLMLTLLLLAVFWLVHGHSWDWAGDIAPVLCNLGHP